jgi:hypothetical protein
LGGRAVRLRGTMWAGQETASRIERLAGFNLAGRAVYRASLADGCLHYTRVTSWIDYGSASQPTILVFCNERCTFCAGARERIPLKDFWDLDRSRTVGRNIHGSPF